MEILDLYRLLLLPPAVLEDAPLQAEADANEAGALRTTPKRELLFPTALPVLVDDASGRAHRVLSPKLQPQQEKPKVTAPCGHRRQQSAVVTTTSAASENLKLGKTQKKPPSHSKTRIAKFFSEVAGGPCGKARPSSSLHAAVLR